MKHLAVGAKSVIGSSRKVLEDCLNVRDKEDVTCTMVGNCTQGAAGGGLLYTDEESISIGVAMHLDNFGESGLSSSDVHDHMLHHSAIAPLLEDDILLKYERRLTTEDGPAMTSHDPTRPELIIVGGAAGLTLNTGLTIRGMDLVVGSTLAAAETIRKALQAMDFSQEAMDAYRGLLDSGFVGEDMATYVKAPALLKHPRMYRDYGKLTAEVFYGIFSHDLKSRRHICKVGIDALRAPGLKFTQIMGDVLVSIRAL